MAKREDPLLEALQRGLSYTWTIPEGGDLASMRKAVKHGQTLTMSPLSDPPEVLVGDMVLVRWHEGTIFHLVGEIQDDKYLIVNSLGKVYGWVSGDAILGTVTEIVEPEERPEVPEMLDQLEASYQKLIVLGQPGQNDGSRLLSIAQDLRWYAGRLGAERWDKMPQLNKWSFEQHLWRLSRRANKATASKSSLPIHFVIDRGKECVRSTAELLALFESPPRE
jgi:hypothetical protein